VLLQESEVIIQKVGTDGERQRSKDGSNHRPGHNAEEAWLCKSGDKT